VKNELQRVRGSRQKLRAGQSERDDLVRQLRNLYEQAGIADENLGAAAKQLEALLGQGASAARANHDADAAAQALDTLLGGSTLGEFQTRVAEAERALSEHVARYDTLASQGGDKPALQRELAELQHEASDTRDRVTEAQTRMSALEEEIGGSAELEERRVELKMKIGRLEQAKEAVGIAREVLREAADELNRQFQPHLRDALTRNLPRITGGRYQDVEIDNELGVHVVVPGVARQIGVDQLSRATKDQVFLVERLEIARLLAPAKGTAPLLLDDPFAHYDAKRLRFGLQLLREAAEERQVFVFSEDADLPAVTSEVCGDFKLTELTTSARMSL
jgi:DNA repair protein SbcC/Rad50